MNRATKARSNTVRGALSGSAGHIFLTLNGMRARLSRARVDSAVSFSPRRHWRLHSTPRANS